MGLDWKTRSRLLLRASWPISLVQLGQMRDYGNATEDQKGHGVVSNTPVWGSGVASARDSVTDELRFVSLFSNEARRDTDKTESR